MQGAAILGGNDYEYSEAHGGFINGMHRRIGEILGDIDPEIEVLWIPRDKREEGDKPFALRHTPSDGRKPYIFATYDEPDFDLRVIEQVLEMRATVQGAKESIIDQLDRSKRVKHMMLLKEQEEKQGARHEEAQFLLRTNKHTIDLGNGRKLYA